jgi:hypothetical protein
VRSQIITRKEDFAGGSTVLPTLSEGMEIELSDCEAENVRLRGDYLRQGVEILMGDVPTVLEVRFMCVVMFRGRTLVKGSLSTNLCNPKRHVLALQKVEFGIELLPNIYLVADIILPGIHFAPLLGRCPSFIICFLINLLLLHKFHSQRIGVGLCLFAASPQ